MFALLAFGTLFGFVGLLLAVPVAASIGVLVRFALARYLQSRLYHAEQPVLIDLNGEAGRTLTANGTRPS
jgi:predicted PurR-regulated permease PerM